MKWEGFLILLNNLLKGDTFKEQGVEIFFGNSHTSLIDIKKKCRTMAITQVHGNRIVDAREDEVRADGHFTDKKNRALIIKTADCMPVFLKNGSRIFALHIGWRGLMKRILTESSSYWLKDRSVKLWVGPHIHQKSFELDIDSARQLIKSHNLKFDEAMALNIFKFSRKQRNHVHVSLSGILLKEAQSLGIKLIQECSINTYDSFKHNSYRRNRFSRLHNYSYIIKHED